MGLIFLRSERMNALQLAKKYRVRLNYIYQVLYDLEALGIISPERSGRRLVLKPFDVAAIEKELQRRGYFSASVSKGD